jgi:hypothetical protein
MTRPRVLELARVAALFAIGLAIGLHYGRMGFMPLDQSICFDGGWRILNGQVPFREYTAPNGFTVHALQALFFAVLGVNWFAYVLHAAVINGLAVVLVDRLLVLFGLERWIASVFALGTAFAFYPPFGVPYMDQHAFFFSLAALVCAVASAREDGTRRQRWLAFSVAPLLALAFLSKQIPSVFFVPAIAAAPLFAGSCAKRLYRDLAIGAIGATVVLFGLALALRVDWAMVDTYFLQLPADEGARRLDYVPGLGPLMRRFGATLVQWGLGSPWLAVCAAIASSIGAIAISRRREAEWRLPLGAGLASLFLLAASLLFVAWTSNQKEIGLALVFASSGCALASALGVARIAEAAWTRARWFTAALIAGMSVCAVHDAYEIARSIDATRSVNDLEFDAARADAATAELPSGLAYLRWSVPKLVQYSPRDLAQLVESLRSRDGGMFLLGDCSPLYGLSGKRSTAPMLWFHPGLTFPLPADARFAELESRLLERIAGVRTVVVEPRVWIGYRAPPGEKPIGRLVTLDTFPRVKAAIETRKSGERDVGAFHVIELTP